MSKHTEEGPRDFARFLALVAHGAALSELSTELQRITGLTRDEARARDRKVTGKLQLALTLTIDPEGHCDVGYDIKVGEPKKQRPETLFFLTPGNNLSDEMTRQERLPIREVPPPAERTLDVGEAGKAKDV